MADESGKLRELEGQMKILKGLFGLFVAPALLFLGSWVYGQGQSVAIIKERISTHADAIVKIEDDVKENTKQASIISGDVRESNINTRNIMKDMDTIKKMLMQQTNTKPKDP
jgi:hypothetical protein